MREKENIRFFRLLTENETTGREFSPFRFGLSKKSAKRVFDAFSVHLLDTPLKIQRHYGINAVCYRIKANYLLRGKLKTYCLTIEAHKNINCEAKKLNKYLKEYFYLKLVFKIFKSVNLNNNIKKRYKIVFLQ